MKGIRQGVERMKAEQTMTPDEFAHYQELLEIEESKRKLGKFERVLDAMGSLRVKPGIRKYHVPKNPIGKVPVPIFGTGMTWWKKV